MKFRQRKDFSENTWAGHVFILTGTKREARMYVFWRNRNPYIPWPVEFQLRDADPRVYNGGGTFPKRRKKLNEDLGRRHKASP